MKKQHVFFLLVIFCVFIVGVYLLFLTPQPPQPSPDADLPRPSTKIPVDVQVKVPVEHLIEGNQHKITGIISLPDPCYSLDHEVFIKESFPEQVVIEFTSTRSDELCATVITDTSFMVEFQASEKAFIEAFLNEQKIQFTKTQ